MIDDTEAKLNAKINIQELTIVDEDSWIIVADFIDITEMYTAENVQINDIIYAQGLYKNDVQYFCYIITEILSDTTNRILHAKIVNKTHTVAPILNHDAMICSQISPLGLTELASDIQGFSIDNLTKIRNLDLKLYSKEFKNFINGRINDQIIVILNNLYDIKIIKEELEKLKKRIVIMGELGNTNNSSQNNNSFSCPCWQSGSNSNNNQNNNSNTEIDPNIIKVITSNTEQINDLKVDKEQILLQLHNLAERITALEEEIGRLQNGSSNVDQDTLDAIQKNTEQINLLKDSRQELINQLNDLTEQINSLEFDINLLKDNNSYILNDIISNKQEISKLKDDIILLKNTINSGTESAPGIIELDPDILNKINSNSLRIEQLENDVEGLGNELDSLKNNGLTELDPAILNKIINNSEQIDSIKTEIELLKNNTNSGTTELDPNVLNIIASNTTRIIQLENKFNSLESGETPELDYNFLNAISSNTERIIKLETDVNLLKNTDQTKPDSSAIDNIISRIEQLENKFNSLETSVPGESGGPSESDYNFLTAIANNTAQINLLKAEFEEFRNNNTGDFTSELNSLTNTVNDLIIKVNNIENSLSNRLLKTGDELQGNITLSNNDLDIGTDLMPLNKIYLNELNVNTKFKIPGGTLYIE